MNTATTRQPRAQARPLESVDRSHRQGTLRDFRWLSIDRAEWRISVRLGAPIMMTVWVNMGMSLTDTWMVSRLGPEAMAAVAVASDAYSIVFYFFAGVIAGLMPALSAAVGNSSRSRVQQLWAAGWVVCALCLVVALPALWFSPSLLGHLGVPSALLAAGGAYTRLLAVSLVPQLAISVMRSMLVAHHRPRLFFYVSLCALPLNAVLNVALIHGAGPIGAMGVTGAGVATLLTGCSTAVVLAVVLCREDFAAGGELRIRAATLSLAGLLGDCRLALRVGVPIGTTALAEVGIYLAATVYIASLSVAAVAAHTLAMRLAGVAYALPLALAQVATTRLAQASSWRARRVVIRTQFQLAFCSALLLGSSLALLAGPAAALLNDGSELGQRAAQTACLLILLLALTELVEPFTVTASGLLRGREDTFAPMVYSVTCYWLFSVPLALWVTPPVRGRGRIGLAGVAGGHVRQRCAVDRTPLSGVVAALRGGCVTASRPRLQRSMSVLAASSVVGSPPDAARIHFKKTSSMATGSDPNRRWACSTTDCARRISPRRPVAGACKQRETDPIVCQAAFAKQRLASTQCRVGSAPLARHQSHQTLEYSPHVRVAAKVSDTGGSPQVRLLQLALAQQIYRFEIAEIRLKTLASERRLPFPHRLDLSLRFVNS